MWSLGCILAELYTGYALLPGEDEADQLACIIELLGLPPKQVLENSKRAKIFINAKGYPRYCLTKTLEDGSVLMTEGFSRRGIPRGPPGSRKLKDALNGCDDIYFVSFIKECLEWIPEKRLTPDQAIKHSWFRRRLPKPPSSYSSTSCVENKQPQSLNIAGGGNGTNDGSSTSSLKDATIGTKGITTNCYYYDNTIHQIHNNHHPHHQLEHTSTTQTQNSNNKLTTSLIDNFNNAHKVSTLPHNATFQPTAAHLAAKQNSFTSDKNYCDLLNNDLNNRKSFSLTASFTGPPSGNFTHHNKILNNNLSSSTHQLSIGTTTKLPNIN
jgi:serine/threonine protein kinase